MSISTSDKSIFSVSQLARKSRQLLESHFGMLWVEGEISNLHRHGASGHWYFSLKDDRAQLRCAMFRNRNQHCRIQPQNGTKVRLRGQLSLYEARGDFQLIAEFMEDAGAGALQAAFDALKNKLAAEGLFASERKQRLPEHPRHIAIVTSASGAAIADMLSVFARRSPATLITLLPVAVQGDGAAADIAHAINNANQWHDDDGAIDAIIIGRGGGSQEDLWAFNEEIVARAVFASTVPVVSAVGHETDFSIADMVADVRAPTPSAAAELLSADTLNLQALLSDVQQQLQRLMRQQLSGYQQTLRHLQQRLHHPGRRIEDAWQRCDELEQRLHHALQQRLQQAATTLRHQHKRLQTQSPQRQCQQLAQRIERSRQALIQQMQQILNAARTRHVHQAQLLHSLSPLNTLERGYAIVSDQEGSVITQAQSQQPGNRIQARLGRGRLWCTVDEVEKDPDQQAPA